MHFDKASAIQQFLHCRHGVRRVQGHCDKNKGVGTRPFLTSFSRATLEKATAIFSQVYESTRTGSQTTY